MVLGCFQAVPLWGMREGDVLGTGWDALGKAASLRGACDAPREAEAQKESTWEAECRADSERETRAAPWAWNCSETMGFATSIPKAFLSCSPSRGSSTLMVGLWLC